MELYIRELLDSVTSIPSADAVELFVELPAGTEGQRYRASLSLLMCSQSACQPVDRVLEGQVPQEMPALAAAPWGAGYRKGKASFDADQAADRMRRGEGDSATYKEMQKIFDEVKK